MKQTGFGVILILVLPVILACGVLDTVTNTVTGGESYSPAAELWSDVPRMDGLTPSELEDIPLPVKLIMRTVLGNLGRLNPEGEDQTTGSIDWISFNLSGAPADVGSFYTPDLMTANGWEHTDNSTCVSASQQGMPQGGVFCVFQKNQGGTETQLAIIATQEDASKPTGVFFLRLEGPAATSQ
jgi:hypothetical protein